MPVVTSVLVVVLPSLQVGEAVAGVHVGMTVPNVMSEVERREASSLLERRRVVLVCGLPLRLECLLLLVPLGVTVMGLLQLRMVTPSVFAK